MAVTKVLRSFFIFRRGKKLDKLLFKTIFKRIMSVTLIVFAIACGVGFAFVYIAPASFLGSSSIEPVVGGRVNILLLATDESGLRTDTIMFASFDSDRHLLNIMSIPRDTRLLIGKSHQKINAAFALGDKDKRQDTTIKYVKELTGMPVNYYAVVHPKGFRDVIDTLGGVYLDVPSRMYYKDPEQDLYIDLKPGYQKLDGDKAEQYTRFRSYPTGDLGRVEAQQRFIKALFEQKLKPEYILKSGELFSKLSQAIKTNFKMSDIPLLIKLLQPMTKESLRTYEMPGAPQMVSGISYVICDIAKTKELINTEFLGKAPKEPTTKK
jgi:LCP family protein required for cell wall assembly